MLSICPHQFKPYSTLDYRLCIKLAMEQQRPHKPWCLQGAPIQRDSKEETFAALAVTYGFTKEVANLFLKGAMEDLEDFRYYFSDEDEIDAFVRVIWEPMTPAPLEPEEEPEALLKNTADSRQLASQISRVKQAWRATRRLPSRKENLDMIRSLEHQARNHFMGWQVIKKFKAQFWERYKQTHPAAAFPSRRLLKHCHYQISLRHLPNHGIQKHLTSASHFGTDDRIQKRYSVENYMAMLHTYLLALAVVGTDKVEGAPPNEEFESDPTKFIKIPWDILQAYYFRAAQAIRSVPKECQLAWLEAKDSEERAAWASRFCNGTETLGQVVKALLETRATHWAFGARRTSTQNREVPPYIAVATPEPSSHGSQFEAWNQEIENTRKVTLIPQQLPPLTRQKQTLRPYSGTPNQSGHSPIPPLSLIHTCPCRRTDTTTTQIPLTY